MVGAAVSVTVMVKLQLPPPVEDETLTVVVVPTAKNVPEAGELVTVPQSPDDSISPAKLTIAPDWVPCVVLALTVRFSGQANEQVGADEPAARISSFVLAVLVVGFGSVVVLLISTS